jgi:hypothetical protein
MTFIAVRCPLCQSDDIVKRGKMAWGTQRYLCQNTLCAEGNLRARATRLTPVGGEAWPDASRDTLALARPQCAPTGGGRIQGGAGRPGCPAICGRPCESTGRVRRGRPAKTDPAPTESDSRVVEVEALRNPEEDSGWTVLATTVPPEEGTGQSSSALSRPSYH